VTEERFITLQGRSELIARIDELVARIAELERSQERIRAAAQAAVRLWGEQHQLRMLTEECGELIAAVNQHERGRIGDEALASECADVLIMLAQARHILGKKFDVQLEVKLTRLEHRLRHEP
jgi:NTP pyrophosphatase (non-canonical NTP hydrolase)